MPPLLVGAAMMSAATQQLYMVNPVLEVNPLGQSAPACNYNFGNSSFNLQPLKLTAGFYHVNDDRNNQGSMNYTYFFNVCNNIDFNASFFPYPRDCNTTFPGPGGGTEAISAPSPAFQYANVPVPDSDKCHRLGGDAASGGNIQWGLYDINNPSAGVVIQYLGGDTCPNSGGKRRSLKLWLNCYNDQGSVPTDETVLESSMCTYDIFVNSALGCPAECPLVPSADGQSKNLCARHGVCEYDRVLGNSRCFCNEGWAGNDCSQVAQAPPSGLSAVGGVLLGVSLLLVSTLGFLVYLWRRIRGLRLDPSAYASLRGGEEGEAEAA